MHSLAFASECLHIFCVITSTTNVSLNVLVYAREDPL